jgi:hypothetical protein
MRERNKENATEMKEDKRNMEEMKEDRGKENQENKSERTRKERGHKKKIKKDRTREKQRKTVTEIKEDNSSWRCITFSKQSHYVQLLENRFPAGSVSPTVSRFHQHKSELVKCCE